MARQYKAKIIGAGVFVVLLVQAFGSMAVAVKKGDSQPLGILEYDPKSHDFGNMIQGEINSTIFEIWTSGGCCELIFNLTWNCTWVSVFPTSGTTNGEHIPITVTVDTHGLDNGFHNCGILITTNGGGDGIFDVMLTVIKGTHPTLAFNPRTYNFGTVPENTVHSTTFDIWNSGNGTLNYTVSSMKNWISVFPISGSSVGEHDLITVTINTHGLQNDTTYESNIYIESNGGNDVFVITVTVGTMPKFEMTMVKGGLFKIKTGIKNNGTADAIGVDWKISVGGLGFVLFGKQTNGTIDKLSVGQEMTIPTGMIFGLGPVIVTLIVQNSEALPLVKRMIAELLFFYIKL